MFSLGSAFVRLAPPFCAHELCAGNGIVNKLNSARQASLGCFHFVGWQSDESVPSYNDTHSELSIFRSYEEWLDTPSLFRKRRALLMMGDQNVNRWRRPARIPASDFKSELAEAVLASA